MERLIDTFQRKLQHTSLAFVRSLMHEIRWEARLVGIRGARGVGKTTMLLQHIRLHYPADPTVLYVSLDNIYFSSHTLYASAHSFVDRGGRRLSLDEVHKYPT